MTDFCIQIHPDRSADLDLARVRAICESMAVADKDLIKRFAFLDRPADGDEAWHVNLIFDTDRPADLWRLIRERLYESDGLARPMQMSSLSMCEGEHGWRDYLLLYHYDPRERLNRLDGQPRF
ncbi:hypothetical protein [Hyphomicrobium sp.]|uniref:hypothetical protein n=1 Tax=Hyphomicrobium sp. TaxID=82 RepID=UPI0025BDDA80|nr:hypothetical protein [Hyphomicrobium sp.]MCC7251295.1 hypothetical protein [Hyphomicrobium sp.]